MSVMVVKIPDNPTLPKVSSTFDARGLNSFLAVFGRVIEKVLGDLSYRINRVTLGDVVKVGTPVDNQVAIWTGTNAIEGDSGFTYDGTDLTLGNDITATGVITGNSVVLAVASDTVAGIIEYAVQSEMETGTSNVRAVTPGRQQFHPSAAKVWASLAQDGTAYNASYNTSSLTDNGVGDYTVVIDVDFSSTNYAVVVTVAAPSAGNAARIGNFSTKAAGSIRCLAQTLSTSATTILGDRALDIACFGDQ